MFEQRGAWILTDDGSHQHVRTINANTYELIEMQISNPDDHLYEVYTDTICLDDYGPDEIKGILYTFGYSSIQEIFDEYQINANQIIAECIFEYYGSFALDPLAASLSAEAARNLIRQFVECN